MTEKLPIRLMLTVIEATDPEPVPNKKYQRMSVKATTDKTGEEPYVFTTFYPSVMEMMKKSIGQTIECQVIMDEKKIVGVVSPDKNNVSQAQIVIRAIADMSLSETITIPEDVLDNHWKLIRKWQSEALKQ